MTAVALSPEPPRLWAPGPEPAQFCMYRWMRAGKAECWEVNVWDRMCSWCRDFCREVAADMGVELTEFVADLEREHRDD